jgi:protein-S-isoprenylcysteine O-methyltransferase Ste14
VTRLPALGPRGEGWVLLQFLFLALVAWAGTSAGDAWDGPAAWLAAVTGVALLVAAVALIARGFRGLGRNLTAAPRPRDGAQLVDTGIYARVRHPIYGGLVLGALGWSLAQASLLALPFVAALAIVLDLKSRREEAWLQERFPGYGAYRARTRRMIPWLY